MNARSMAFVRVCGGVLASVFALSFAAEKAFAQTQETCARSDAYTQASGEHAFSQTAFGAVTLSAPVADIPVPGGSLSSFLTRFVLLHNGARIVGSEPISNNGLIQFTINGSIREVQASDLVELNDGTAPPEITVRVYAANGDSGADDVLHFAEPEPVAEGVCENALVSGQFFLDGNWKETQTAADGNQGYVAPEICGEDEILNEAGDECIPDPNAPEENNNAPTDSVRTERGESKVRDNAWTAFGGALAVGVLSYLLSDGTLLGYSATPDFGYSLTESGYSYNYGGRVDFHKDRWHLYWTAGQQSVNGDFGDFRYSSGGKWQGDIFAAAFSEKVQGKTADYDLSLSANYDGGIWKLSPAFAIDSVYEKGEFQTTNSFRINGEMRYDDWRFSASGNKTQMELSAVYRF